MGIQDIETTCFGVKGDLPCLSEAFATIGSTGITVDPPECQWKNDEVLAVVFLLQANPDKCPVYLYEGSATGICNALNEFVGNDIELHQVERAIIEADRDRTL